MKSQSKLIIVESPTKARMIKKFLGSGFDVEASMGHVRDLPKSKIGIDVKHNFEPTYVISPKAKPVVEELKKLAEHASEIILAPDPDREGEAIAWHLTEALGLNVKSKMENGKRSASSNSHSPFSVPLVKRIAFHEITKAAIEEALTHPREIDQHLVDAQQARRVLDRLVGYELSPFLWRKIRYGLSAGRVQSVAVRLVVEREREIEKFNKEEYWTIEGLFAKKEGAQTFPAKLNAVGGKTLDKFAITKESDAQKIVQELEGASYAVSQITSKEVTRTPAPPFTTSTLQQEAARKLGLSAKQTMMIAQQLYETGVITYMRTDSVAMGESALAQAAQTVRAEFGSSYALKIPRQYTTKSKGAQEAHEAIRPTDFSKKPGNFSLKDKAQKKVYDLIWKRAIASQMQPARLEQTSIDIEAKLSPVTSNLSPSHTFRATGSVVLFDGFIRAYTEGKDDENDDDAENTLPKLVEKEALEEKELNPIQHFTEPPPRYTDATLVKALEVYGIGRPSTYAPTLSTIQDRGYVEKLEKKYHPTEIGILVNDMLVENFPEIVDVNFTSHIEEELDDIAEGKIGWTEVAREFYGPFKKHLTEKEETVEKKIEISTTPCPHCSKMMVIKFGRMGKFLACPDPEVKVTLPMPEEAAQIKELEEKTRGEMCPLCGKSMAVKRGRFGYFLGCTDYPKCKGISKIWNKTGFKCPNCEAQLTNNKRLITNNAEVISDKLKVKNLVGDIVEKKGRGRGKPFYACTRYPDCTFLMNKNPESEAELQGAYKNWKENPPKPRAKRSWEKKTPS